MRDLVLAMTPALPAAAGAQTAPGPECRIEQECVGTVCQAHGLGVVYGFAPEGGGIRMTNLSDPIQTMLLNPIPGDGLPAWTGRSPRRDAAVMVGPGRGGRLAVTIHNGDEAELVYTLLLNCAPPGAPTLTK
jgi:hypothetical protein